jgi:Glycoside hydrolase 123, catalytic domain/Glycoside hydrolase 123 N-terminal domain
MKSAVLGVVVCVVTVWAGAMPGVAQDAKAAPKDTGPVVVLSTKSVWRSFPVLKPPVVEFDDGIKPLTSAKVWLDKETQAAPRDWTKPEFADGTWLRGTARTFPHTPYLANLCTRARFEVTDPAQVKSLKLSVAYYGGAIVYVNGEEIARANLPQGVKGPSALAEGYPVEAFVTDKGDLVPGGWATERYKKALAARERKLTDIAIPSKILRKGTNVLAIEIIRAPYNKILNEKKHAPKNREVKKVNCPYNFRWYTCEVRQVSLIAGGAGGLVPNVTRPKELQAWNSDYLAADYVTDFGDRCDGLRPVVIKGPRNGWSSGKVVVGSPKAIEGLKVTIGDLKQGASVIPAAQVRARFAVPYGTRANSPLDTLLEAPLETFPATHGAAVVPIWLTVRVPRDARPGKYTGQVTVEARGEKPLVVPVSLEVADFAVPDTQDYRTWIELMQSPDSVAVEYNVPLWSEKHWTMIADAMRHIGEIGSRVVHIPLIAQTNYGNAESMVRWIKKDDGTCTYDFSVMDKYLDLAVKHMGKPKQVVFTAWEIYLKSPEKEVIIKETDSNYTRMEKSWRAARWNLRDKGPAVTALDPATGKTETVNLPRYEDPAAKALWKSLFDALRKRMAARGLEDTMQLGMASDAWPTKGELTALQEVSGGLPWIMHTHGGSRVGVKMRGIADVSYIAYVWNVRYAKDPGKQLYGWKRPELYAEFRRFGSLNAWPPSTILLFSELQITGAQRGLGRVGADFWAVIKDKRGRRQGRVWERYPQSLWHSCNMFSHMLNPGPTGPVASTRYEQMREGIQQCEARIAIEAALTDETLKAKVGSDLAGRCQRLLDDRVWEELKAFSNLQLTGRSYATSANSWGYGCGGLAGHYWYAGSGWQDRTQRLYEFAGEVTRKLAEK